MNFSTLKTELLARGFSDLTDARAGVYINNARAELDRMHLWPWREKSGTGIAPVSVTDLGVIEKVVNESRNDTPLLPAQYSNLVDWYGDLSVLGTPQFYYVAWPSGTPVVATYPDSTDTIGIQYWKVTADLTGTDTPASPTEAHYLIVDLAVRRACRDVNDHEGAEAIQGEIDRQIGALLEQYPPGIGDDPGHMIVPGPQ